MKNLICRSRKMRLHSIALQLSEPSPRTTGNSWKVRAVGGFFGLTTEWPQPHSLTHRKGCTCRSYRRRLTERSGLITQNNDLTGSQRGHCMCILKTKYIQKALQRVRVCICDCVREAIYQSLRELMVCLRSSEFEPPWLAPPNFWPLLDHWSEVESQRSPPRPIRSVNSPCCRDHRLTCCHADKAGHRQDRKLRQGPRNTRSYTYTHLSDRSQINNSLHSRLSSSRFLLRYLEHNRIAGCFIMVWTCWKRGRAEMCVKQRGRTGVCGRLSVFVEKERIVWETDPLDKRLFFGGGLTADSHPSLAPLLIPLTLYCTYCEPCECVLLCLRHQPPWCPAITL